MALYHRGRALPAGPHELDSLFDYFRIFVSISLTTRRALIVPTVSLYYRPIVYILEHRRVDSALYMVHDTLDFIGLDEDSLEASRCHGARREVEHITASEEVLRSDRVEYRTRVYLRCHGECDTRWDIRLYQSCDDIHTRSLCREYHMESYGTCFLSDAGDRLLDFFLVPAHHEICELVDDDDDDWHAIFWSYFRIILFEITDIERLQCAIATLHLCDRPLEGIEGFIWMIYDGCQEVRDTIIDTELHLLRIHHDHTELTRSIFIEEREDKSVHPYRLTTACLARDEEVWHLCEISGDIVTIYILTHGERDLRLMMGKYTIFEYFADTDDISLFIGYLDTDESESWDRCLDTDRFGLEGEGEVFF